MGKKSILEKNLKCQNNKGITLIALAITIIVLLILASVSIAILASENGILEQANTAKEQTEIKDEEEIILRAMVSAMKKDANGNLNISDLESELDKHAGPEETNVKQNEDMFEIMFCDCGHSHIVDCEGNFHQKIDNEEDDNAIELTDEYIKIDDVYIDVYIGNIDNVEFPPYEGIRIETAKILKNNDKYYVVKDAQYLPSKNDWDNYINNYCIQLNVEKGFVEPDSNTEAGDLRLMNGRAYVFTPYGWFENCWNELNWWKLLDEYVFE